MSNITSQPSSFHSLDLRARRTTLRPVRPVGISPINAALAKPLAKSTRTIICPFIALTASTLAGVPLGSAGISGSAGVSISAIITGSRPTFLPINTDFSPP